MKRSDRQRQTKQALLDAAAVVVADCGFGASSIEAIVSEAGFTRGAFYSNFTSKEELFAELLQDRVYAVYGQMAVDAEKPDRPGPREVGEKLAAIQAHPDGRWLFRLWLELLAHAGRDERFRAIAAGFWSANRAATGAAIAQSYEAAGDALPAAPDRLASAMIALDIGLALQHFVDPDAVPLDTYPELFELLFGPLSPDA